MALKRPLYPHLCPASLLFVQSQAAIGLRGQLAWWYLRGQQCGQTQYSLMAACFWFPVFTITKSW